MTERPGNTAVILVEPKLSENVGTAARAAANMGLGRIIAVAPGRLEKDVMLGASTRVGARLIEEMAVAGSLEEALADIQFAAATTARAGNHRGPFISPGRLAEQAAALGPDVRVGLVFGPERSGLTTAHLRLCQAVVRIPTASPQASSLNLAQAVLILGYEMMQAARRVPPEPAIQPAPLAEVNAMYDHLGRMLRDIGFLPDQNPEHWLMSFKRIFNRSGLTHGDCNLIRGVCRQVYWALDRAGRERGPAGP